MRPLRPREERRLKNLSRRAEQAASELLEFVEILSSRITKPRTSSPLLEEMRAETKPGHCICCDEPLPPRVPGQKKQDTLCGSRECKRLYWSVWRQGDRLARRNRALAELGGAA